MAFPPLGNSYQAVVSVSIDLPVNSKQDPLSHCIAYDYLCTDWDGLCDHLRDVPWKRIFKINAATAATKFCEWVQVGIDGLFLIISIHFFISNQVANTEGLKLE